MGHILAAAGYRCRVEKCLYRVRCVSTQLVIFHSVYSVVVNWRARPFQFSLGRFRKGRSVASLPLSLLSVHQGSVDTPQEARRPSGGHRNAIPAARRLRPAKALPGTTQTAGGEAASHTSVQPPKDSHPTITGLQTSASAPRSEWDSIFPPLPPSTMPLSSRRAQQSSYRPTCARL